MTASLDSLAPRLGGAPSVSRSHGWLLDPSAPAWPGASIVTFDVEVPRERALGLLPPGVRPAKRPMVTWFVAHYAKTSFGIEYRECGLLVHGRMGRDEVRFCAWMVVDDDCALVLGRELLGFPKKMADIELVVGASTVRAAVKRRGVTLLSVDGELGAPRAPEKAFGVPIVNVWGLPVAPSLLLRIEVPERPIEAREARLGVTVRGSVADAIEGLGAGVVEGRWLVSDVGVPPPGAGRVPRGVRPAGLVGPSWLLSQMPHRCL